MKKSKALKSIGVGLAVLVALVVYAYGFQVTQVNLAETKSERRQTQLVRILRALAKPDFFRYEQQEYVVETPIMVPCPDSGFNSEPVDTSKPYMVVTPACAGPGEDVHVEGFNFAPNTTGPLNFIPPSEVSLPVATIQTDAGGHFVVNGKLPKRPNEEVQRLRAVTRQTVGGPVLTQTAIDTWDKIVETVFLALLATTLGTFLAIPLSFLAARNLMKDVGSPLISVALDIIAIPAGLLAGGWVAGRLGTISDALDGQSWLILVGLIILPAIAWFIARWALPQEEISAPRIRIRIARMLVLIAASLLVTISLFFLSKLVMIVGAWLAGRLGGFGFLGTFVRDLGEILGMLIPVMLALVGAGVASNLVGKIGQIALKRLSTSVARLLAGVLSVIAGFILGAILGAGVEWLYQIGDPVKTLWLPGAIGAVLGLLLAIRYRVKSVVPIGMVVYYIARTLFNALRSIEALIMVIVFVVWVGIGPFAGVLALSLHTVASLAKLYSEQVESILAGPVEAIKATGANRLQTIVYAVIPQIIPPYISYTMYRWDINVRMSTIIGFAGGGGIGFLLIQNINLLNYRAASAQMIAIALVVATMDYLSSRMREEVV
ncbi:MAG TPA: ABC transporter permease subunit [Anaerolineaceae bacterium]|nr:ABC transporter permease subunit [Anaerolineaceae bacterium]